MEAKPAAALEAAPAAVPAARSPRRSPRKAKERRPSLTLQGLQFSTLVTGKTSGRIYGSHSLCFFSVSHPVRRFAIDAIEWVWFDRIVLLLIVINCVFLAITDPTCPDGCSHRDPKVDAVLMHAEYAFCALFTAEMALKALLLRAGLGLGASSAASNPKPSPIPSPSPCPDPSRSPSPELHPRPSPSASPAVQVVAEGLVGHRNAYLWSGWNWLDFVVVVVGWLTLSGATSGGMSALRSVRTLPP